MKKPLPSKPVHFTNKNCQGKLFFRIPFPPVLLRHEKNTIGAFECFQTSTDKPFILEKN